MLQSRIKYYGTLIATLFVLALSTQHISEALQIVERSTGYYDDESGIFSSTWFAAAGLQLFEVLTGIGVADLLQRRKRSLTVLRLLIVILIFFFLINVFGNTLHAFANMVQENGRKMTVDKIVNLDALQIFWVLWAAIPIPLMGIAGITVQAIFRKDLNAPRDMEESSAKKKIVGKAKIDELEKPAEEVKKKSE